MIKIYVDGHLNGMNITKKLFENSYSSSTFQNANSGYTLISINNKVIKIPYLKSFLTNSEAELIAIAHGTLLAKEGDEILSDSQWAVNIATSRFKPKDERFKIIACFLKSTIEFKLLKVLWIPREKNPIT